MEEHYLRHRKLILFLLAVPTIVSVASHVRVDRVPYTDGEVIWVATRTALPLTLLAFPSRPMQRVGLVLLNVVQLIGLLGGLFR